MKSLPFSPGTNWLRQLRGFAAGEGSVAFFVLGCLLIVAWSLQQADWVETPSLLLVMALGFLTGMVLCRIRRRAIFLHLPGLVIGAATVVWMCSTLVQGDSSVQEIRETLARIGVWWRAVAGGGINADRLPFAFLLVSFSWLVAYFCAWLVLRHRNYWGAVLVTGAALIINMSALLSEGWIEFFLFMLAVLLLRARMQTLENRAEWSRAGKSPGGRAGGALWRGGVVLTVAVTGSAFLLPLGKEVKSFDPVYRFMHAPIEHYTGDFDRLFAGLSSRVPMAYRVFDSLMPLGGAVKLSDTPSLVVQSPFPVYLRAHTYDTYSGGGWRSNRSETPDTNSATVSTEAEVYASKLAIAVTVKPLYPSKTRFVAGDLVDVDRPSNVEVYAPPVYVVNLRDSLPNSRLPQTMRSIAAKLQAAWRSRPGQAGNPTKEEIQKLLPADVKVVGLTYQRNVPEVLLQRDAPNPPDLVSVEVREGSPVDPYKVTASFSAASPAELQAAVSSYPGWVADRYLQLPASLPQRVRDLAGEAVRGAATPYDKAVAVQNYLREIYPYELNIDPPPYNQDGVDYFLFNVRKGYCDYFSSAMAVMLRAEGVPARVVGGYAPGEAAKDGSFLVRDRDAHSWPQVYFPGYGWVEFEPTPNRPLIAQNSGLPEDLSDIAGSGQPVMDEEPFPEDEFVS
ncbi:MAG: transglutaminase domain-containing protein, partial [Chloroflexi bacterium]|nr:transglutaminase domain-containing protein [Chloroflexota bacterium]